jgi:hypothetical protein
MRTELSTEGSGLLKTGFWSARDATRNSLREHGEDAAEQVEHTSCTEALCKRTENAVEPRLSLTDARCLTALSPLKHFFQWHSRVRIFHCRIVPARLAVCQVSCIVTLP